MLNDYIFFKIFDKINFVNVIKMITLIDDIILKISKKIRDHDKIDLLVTHRDMNKIYLQLMINRPILLILLFSI